MNAKQSCIKCNKGGGVATCGGCQQWFCTKHFVEHRQELTTQIDNLGQEHDLLQRDLIEDHRKHPLLSYINNWEQKAIETIQNAAKKARSDLEKYVGENKKDLKVSLEQVSSAIKLCRESEDFTELELNKWFEQIKEIRNVLEKLPTSCIINENNTQNVLCLIEVEQTDRLKKPLKRSSDSVTSNTSLEYSAYRLPHPPGSIEDQSLANVMVNDFSILYLLFFLFQFRKRHQMNYQHVQYVENVHVNSLWKKIPVVIVFMKEHGMKNFKIVPI